MSQNALLDRETVTQPAEPMPIIAERDLPVARTQRDHLTLVDWNLGANATKSVTPARAWAPVRPVRRRWFGPYEASIALLLLSSAVAGLVSLLHLG